MFVRLRSLPYVEITYVEIHQVISKGRDTVVILQRVVETFEVLRVLFVDIRHLAYKQSTVIMINVGEVRMVSRSDKPISSV